MKYKYTCKDCEYCCPFVKNDMGNCSLDMKEVNVEKGRCSKFRLETYVRQLRKFKK